MSTAAAAWEKGGCGAPWVADGVWALSDCRLDPVEPVRLGEHTHWHAEHPYNIYAQVWHGMGHWGMYSFSSHTSNTSNWQARSSNRTVAQKTPGTFFKHELSKKYCPAGPRLSCHGAHLGFLRELWAKDRGECNGTLLVTWMDWEMALDSNGPGMTRFLHFGWAPGAEIWVVMIIHDPCDGNSYI